MYAALRCTQNPPSLRRPADGFPIMNHRPIRMLRLPQVVDATGLGKTKIYELQGRGDFPMRIKITAHAVAWVEEEVQAWLAQRVEKGRPESEPEGLVIPGQSASQASRKRAR
jgi:prophage regulatory protein